MRILQSIHNIKDFVLDHIDQILDIIDILLNIYQIITANWNNTILYGSLSKIILSGLYTFQKEKSCYE